MCSQSLRVHPIRGGLANHRYLPIRGTIHYLQPTDTPSSGQLRSQGRLGDNGGAWKFQEGRQASGSIAEPEDPLPSWRPHHPSW